MKHNIIAIVLSLLFSSLAVSQKALAEEDLEDGLVRGSTKQYLQCLEQVRNKERMDLLSLIVGRLTDDKKWRRSFQGWKQKGMALGASVHTLIQLRHLDAVDAIWPHANHSALDVKALAYGLLDSKRHRSLVLRYLDDMCGRNCMVAWTAAMESMPGDALRFWMAKRAFSVGVIGGGLRLGGGAGGAFPGGRRKPDYSEYPRSIRYRVDVKREDGWTSKLDGAVMAEGRGDLGWEYRIVALDAEPGDYRDITSGRFAPKASDVALSVFERLTESKLDARVCNIERVEHSWDGPDAYVKFISGLIQKERAARLPVLAAAKERGWLTDAQVEECMLIRFDVWDSREDQDKPFPAVEGGTCERFSPEELFGTPKK